MGVIMVKGSAKVVKLYNVSRLEMEGVDWDNYDMGSQEEIRELFELINDFVEGGEADALEPPLELRGVDPDDCLIRVGEGTVYPDEVTLFNLNITDLLHSIQEADLHDIYYIRSMEGDGQWLLEVEGEVEREKLSLDYVDCSIYFDEYDVLREGYLDTICDTLLPERLKVGESPAQVAEFIFDPIQVYGQLYRVVEDPVSGVKVLQKIDYGGRMLAGTDFIVDDFDAN
ncbi:MAG: hypothetical protein GXO19_00920 [Epsilonproteobacteria bacterium]|nr:hypothetical protein [Campylobacterota bacterium]NPA56275.1 hypothetical protein [Campylobacterota bacterium]